MAFAAQLRESLKVRQSRMSVEFQDGEPLEQILSRDLLAVEAAADEGLITSILLLSDDGKRLAHGAAPSLPIEYREAVDGSEIGPCAGSCGTAAYFGRPIYVADIATDPLWTSYRHLALPHGLRSCWSTPIREPRGNVIGTFAIYHTTTGHPTSEEIAAIDLIADHVAHAILLDKAGEQESPLRQRPRLRLVPSEPEISRRAPADRLLGLVGELQSKAAELDRIADCPKSQEVAERLKWTAALSRKLITAMRRQTRDD